MRSVVVVCIAVLCAYGGSAPAQQAPRQIERLEVMDLNPSLAAVERELGQLPGLGPNWLYPGATVDGVKVFVPNRFYPKGCSLVSMRTNDSPEMVRSYYESYVAELRIMDVVAFNTPGDHIVVRFKGAHIDARKTRRGWTSVAIIVGELSTVDTPPPN